MGEVRALSSFGTGRGAATTSGAGRGRGASTFGSGGEATARGSSGFRATSGPPSGGSALRAASVAWAGCGTGFCPATPSGPAVRSEYARNQLPAARHRLAATANGTQAWRGSRRYGTTGNG